MSVKLKTIVEVNIGFIGMLPMRLQAYLRKHWGAEKASKIAAKYFQLAIGAAKF